MNTSRLIIAGLGLIISLGVIIYEVLLDVPDIPLTAPAPTDIAEKYKDL